MTAETNVPNDRRVLVVEDEPDLRDLLTYNLTAAGFNVHATENGTDGLAAVQRFAPDIVLLDLMLPDIPGTEVCRRIRGGEVGSRQPAVMMLTAKGEEIDRVVGFELGADDYVVKPFSVRELVLRVGAILRTPAARRPRAAPRRRNAGATSSARWSWTSTATTSSWAAPRSTSAPWRCACSSTWSSTAAASARARICSRTSGATSPASRPAPSTPTSSACATSWASPGALIETVRGTGYRLSAEHPVVVKD